MQWGAGRLRDQNCLPRGFVAARESDGAMVSGCATVNNSLRQRKIGPDSRRMPLLGNWLVHARLDLTKSG